MGLATSISTQYGQSATYWIVSQITIDNINNEIVANAYGYVSQAAYDGGSLPVAQDSMVIDLFVLTNGQYTTNPQYAQVMCAGGGIIAEIQSLLQSNVANFRAATIVTDTAPTAPTQK